MIDIPLLEALFFQKNVWYLTILIPNMHRKFLFFSLIALLISLFLEITLFNYTHYATLFTSKRFSIAYNQEGNSFSIAYSEGEESFSRNIIVSWV